MVQIGLPLVKNVIKLLAKSVSVPSGLTAAASAADAGTQKKTTLESVCCHSSSLVFRPPSSASKTITLIIPMMR